MLIISAQPRLEVQKMYQFDRLYTMPSELSRPSSEYLQQVQHNVAVGFLDFVE